MEEIYLSKEHVQPQAVINRLSRIEGHIRAIKEMAQRPQASCVELLTQIAAARAALDQTGKVILANHLETCVVSAGAEGRTAEEVQELLTALERFLK
ncbi:MAG: metal-sensitive transcriptional regulator [Bacteroidota bacterium]